ncbi:MAG: nuclear transport factor 2 family protein [Erythrobacter sp.]
MAMMPEPVRAAIERLMVDYCHNLDALSDIDRFAALFTPDAVTDMTAVGFPLMNSRDELASVFAGVFEGLSHSFHAISNFRPESWDGTVGVMTAYVIGMGQPKDGEQVTMHVRYRMECLQTDSGWRCRHYTVTPMMPI